MEVGTHVKVWMKAPPEKVFAYVGDLNRHGEWTKAPLKVHGPVPAQAGAHYHSESKFMGKPVEADLQVEVIKAQSERANHQTEAGELIAGLNFFVGEL